MYRYAVILVTVFCLLNDGVCDVFEEPVCSKFHFEEKVLEKLIKLEVRIDSELKQIADTNNQLETRLTTLTDSIAKTQSTLQDISHMEDKITGMPSSIKDVIRDLQSNVSSQQAMLDKEPSAILKGQPPVLFVAHTTSINPIKDKPIVYEQTVVNHGDGYDTTTGIFTAPVGGVYVFSAQICSANHVRYSIVVNNSPYSYSYQYDTQSGVCSSVSTTALLSKGDTVLVNSLTGGSKVAQFTSSKPLWNMFSGTLVNMVTN